MTDSMRVPGPDETPPLKDDSGAGDVTSRLQTEGDDTAGQAEAALMTEEQKLARRRESKELSKHPADLNIISSINDQGALLTRRHLVSTDDLPRAVVLTYDDLCVLGHVNYLDRNDEPQSIEVDMVPEDATIILFPEDLGYGPEEAD